MAIHGFIPERFSTEVFHRDFPQRFSTKVFRRNFRMEIRQLSLNANGRKRSRNCPVCFAHFSPSEVIQLKSKSRAHFPCGPGRHGPAECLLALATGKVQDQRLQVNREGREERKERGERREGGEKGEGRKGGEKGGGEKGERGEEKVHSLEKDETVDSKEGREKGEG